MIRTLLIGILLISSATFAEDDHFASNFFVGKYLLVGKGLDSAETYLGNLEIFPQGNQLKVKRTIKGQIVLGTATVESALNGDAEVLRLHLIDKNISYEETCLWQSDLDNYTRISCYLYQPGVKTMNPGLEVLFHDPTAK